MKAKLYFPVNKKLLDYNEEYLIDLTKPIDISLPIQHGPKNANAFYADNPEIRPVSSDNFVGSIEQGGHVNYNTISLTPHGNGTHTECIGHVSGAPVTINSCLSRFFFLAELISIRPQKMDKDLVIRRHQIEKKLKYTDTEAVIIRTLPNEESKKFRRYSGSNPPFFEAQAMAYLKQKGIKHLLTDLPSVDKEIDGGKLLAHKNFFNLLSYTEMSETESTITELVYIPDNIEDGLYLLNLQIISIESDASPSKPILYKIS